MKKNNTSKIFIKMSNQKIDFEIKDLNLHNVLASLAVLRELKIDFSKSRINLSN